ncbi:uncharacterized protein LOC135824778 [Sycon ciliatum]|uniref:uncharacterized protein LOC135824778 n=1 Tax=Sycon ciliatum TaxID=27933 RepID=UPI0020ACEC45|eukprot:scpid74040/ scgid14698/ 
MGSVYSVVLMQRKCAYHMELLDREMALNDRIRVRTIMDIASEQDVIEALSSLKAFRGWLGTGRPNSELKDIEKLCDTAVSSACCKTVRKPIMVQAEEITNKANLRILNARNTLSKHIAYLSEYQKLLSGNQRLQSELSRKSIQLDVSESLSQENIDKLKDSAEWKSKRRTVSRLAGKVAYADPMDTSAISTQLALAGFPENEHLNRLISNGVLRAAVLITALGI